MMFTSKFLAKIVNKLTKIFIFIGSAILYLSLVVFALFIIIAFVKNIAIGAKYVQRSLFLVPTPLPTPKSDPDLDLLDEELKILQNTTDCSNFKQEKIMNVPARCFSYFSTQKTSPSPTETPTNAAYQIFPNRTPNPIPENFGFIKIQMPEYR